MTKYKKDDNLVTRNNQNIIEILSKKGEEMKKEKMNVMKRMMNMNIDKIINKLILVVIAILCGVSCAIIKYLGLESLFL